MSKTSNFTTHHIQMDAQDEPSATIVTEANTTGLGTYKVCKYSLGTHFDMNTSNNYYVTLRIAGLNSWRHIVGTMTVSNYSTLGAERFLFGYASSNPGVSAITQSKDVMSSGNSSSFQTVMPSQSPYFLSGMRLAHANSYTYLQWPLRSGKYHPMFWFDFTVASGAYSHLPDIGDITIHAENTVV